jgi:hypothetical protein
MQIRTHAHTHTRTHAHTHTRTHAHTTVAVGGPFVATPGYMFRRIPVSVDVVDVVDDDDDVVVVSRPAEDMQPRSMRKAILLRFGGDVVEDDEDDDDEDGDDDDDDDGNNDEGMRVNSAVSKLPVAVVVVVVVVVAVLFCAAPGAGVDSDPGCDCNSMHRMVACIHREGKTVVLVDSGVMLLGIAKRLPGPKRCFFRPSLAFDIFDRSMSTRSPGRSCACHVPSSTSLCAVDSSGFVCVRNHGKSLYSADPKCEGKL